VIDFTFRRSSAKKLADKSDRPDILLCDLVFLWPLRGRLLLLFLCRRPERSRRLWRKADIYFCALVPLWLLLLFLAEGSKKNPAEAGFCDTMIL
jgi:hypothetical protein